MTVKLPISLCIFVKDEERTLRDCIESVKPIVSEIIVVDTGSTDSTVEIAEKLADYVYKVGFTDFGSIRTLTAHLGNQPWILMLDADERILSSDWDKFGDLVAAPVGIKGDDMEIDSEGNVAIDSWAFPRKRWADVWMHKQVDIESYPDWQVRLFRNHTFRKKIRFVRRVHETVAGCGRTEKLENGPTIHHFQNVEKSEEDLKRRRDMYEKFRALDISEGIEHSQPAVIERDKK